MGHGPSTPSNVSKTRTSPTRNDSFVNDNPDPQASVGSISIQNGSVKDNSPNLKSKSYMSYRRSTASLSKIFQKKRWKRQRGSISASFNMNENDIRVELMNVNTATEEELMTLHGVNRALARNMINHRDLIGGFRKIEDLALVSGMGASKLSQIRSEICISRRKPGFSRASSKAPSIESINSTADSSQVVGLSSSRFLKFVNVNSASIFDLMTVEGINQATAARIIGYRDKKGPFKSIDDIRRVGISHRLFTAIKIHLTTEEFDSERSSEISSTSPVPPPRHNNSKGYIRSISVPLTRPDSRTQHHDIQRSELSNPSAITYDLDDTHSSADMKLIFDLMSIKTKRPKQFSSFNFSHNGCPAYRVASWNLEKLTMEKVNNPGVIEVITRTILENGFSILAVQEICDISVLEKICDELNDPKLSHNREWTGYRGCWKFVLHNSPIHLTKMNHYLGVLYDSAKIEDVLIPDAKEFCPIQNGSLWQFAVFRVKTRNSSWILVNVLSVPLESGTHINGHATNLNQHEVTTSVKSLIDGTQGAMIVGYFSAQQAQKGLSDVKDLERILPDVNEDADVDRIKPCSLWITSGLKECLTDEHGVVDKGLSHLAIPNGYSWGGKVSQSGPLWCTMYDELSDLKNSSGNGEISEDGDEYVPAR